MLAQDYSSYQKYQSSERLTAVDFEGEGDFKIKEYTKSQLAKMYGVHQNTIKKWIDRHLDKFEEIGYHSRLKKLDPCMVRLFITIFSTP